MADDSTRGSHRFGHVIRARRIELGLTQEELAERVGESVRQSDISRMERDHVTLPRRERLDALAAALEVTPGYLLMHSGWMTGEEADHLESAMQAGIPKVAASHPLEPDTSGEDGRRSGDAFMERTPELAAEPSTGLNEAISQARAVSRKTGEILRKTSSTMRNGRRSRRAPS